MAQSFHEQTSEGNINQAIRQGPTIPLKGCRVNHARSQKNFQHDQDDLFPSAAFVLSSAYSVDGRKRTDHPLTAFKTSLESGSSTIFVDENEL